MCELYLHYGVERSLLRVINAGRQLNKQLRRWQNVCSPCGQWRWGIRVKTLSALDCHHHLIHTVFQADAKPTLNSIKISKAVHHPGSNQLSFKYLNLKISD